MLLEEARRHPMAMARALVRRALKIHSHGLPKLQAEVVDDFDRRYGVETAQTVQVVQARSRNVVFGERYETTSEEGIRWCIENAGLDLQATTFLDIGCGKGRTLIIAAQYPFANVTGVEYSAELAAICERNLRTVEARRRCAVVNEDAEHFAFPDGDLLVYMYNPFKRELAHSVLARLADHPGRVALAYRGSTQSIVQETGLFDEIAQGPEAARIYTPRRTATALAPAPAPAPAEREAAMEP